MIRVALYQPEIPPNTGNIMRLCANTGATLHLIRPLGFSIDEPAVKRAGLDYRDLATVLVHEDYAAFVTAIGGARCWAFSTHAKRRYDEPAYAAGDVLLFGPETRGLPASLLEEFGADRCLRLPMRPESRSLNLSNAAAVVVYEAWRQLGFPGGA